MQGEGISRQIYGNAVIGAHVDCRRSNRTDALHGDLLWGKRNIVLLRLLHHLVNQVLIRLARVGATHHRNVSQIVGE